MESKLDEQRNVQLTDWQIFTNNGNFNNPLPPNRRLRKTSPYFLLQIDSNYIADQCRSIRSRHQSAVSTSTRRILSARSIDYRRPPRAKPVDFDQDEEYDQISIYPSTRPQTGRASVASTRYSRLSTPRAWSFSHLHRSIIAIDEQAKKDYSAGYLTNALAAWQNALVFCDELSQRNQLWPENKTALDEEIEGLRRTYRKYMEEIIGKKSAFVPPRRKCVCCSNDQTFDQYHERFNKSCQHVERTICNKCIYDKAKSLVDNSRKSDFICPEPQCKSKLNLKQILPLLVFNNSNDEITTTNENENSQRKSPTERKQEFVWCAYEECGSGQFHLIGPNTTPIVTCVLCKRQTCAIHRLKWHKGLTCSEYDQRRQFSVNPQRPCPKCQTLVEKNSSSEHSICSKCSHGFCWECLVDYKQIERNGARQHKPTCKHYLDPKAKSKDPKSSTCNIL